MQVKFPLPSPRSIEACLRQGILQKDLINKSPDEVKVIFKEKDIDKATLDQRIKFIEERRLEKIKILIDVSF